MTNKKEKMISVIKWIVLLVLGIRVIQHLWMGYGAATIYPKGSCDFQWSSARLLLERIDIYSIVINGKVENFSNYAAYFAGIAPNQFPSTLCFLFPWAIFEPITAKYIWFFSNLIFTILIGIFLRKTFFSKCSLYETIVWCLLMVCSPPWLNQIGNGQHTIFAFCFFMAALYFSERENSNIWSVVAGICLGASWFKYTVTAPLTLYFIYKKRWKTIGIAITSQILLTLVMAWWLNTTVWKCLLYPIQVSMSLSSSGFLDLKTFVDGPLYYVLAMGLLFLSCAISWAGKDISFDNSTLDLSFFSLLLLVSYEIVYHRYYDLFLFVIVFFWLVQLLKEQQRVSKFLNTIGIIMCYIILFGDTLINNFGIVYSSTPQYRIFCAFASCALLLYAFYICLRELRSCFKKI